MPKRIVFHTASLGGGGAERVFVLMANEMAARGHEVTLFTWNATGPNAALRSEAVRLVDIGLPIRGEGFGKPATLKGLWQSLWLLRKLQPDAVYSAPEFANLIIALALILGWNKAKFFPSFHAAASLPSNDLGARIAIVLSALVAGRATKAVAVSAGVGRDLVGRGFPKAKVAVINNPLPAMKIPEGKGYPWQADLAALGDGPVIAAAGRLVPVKDHHTLLRAFAALPASLRARLVIFGEGPLESELRAEATALGIADRVLLPGYVNDPAACYAAADVFVLTSTSEGFGNVLIEAMAAGVPVVSTDAPHGPREILSDGALGSLVPVGDAEALAVAIAETLRHPLGADVLKRRAVDFTVEKIGDRYEALLG
ncbi:MAG TPA: glycosyltransferase [Devosiaceae bacterium]|jgi:glycosyltransferase involved in cell wall biosynthesis